MLNHRRIRKESDPHDIFPVTENPIKKTFARNSTRHTDPMQPTYYIHSTLYHDDDKMKPKRLPQYISDNHLLKTSDIDGAQAGYRSEHRSSIPNSLRKEFRNTNFIHDIEGAQANSKKSTFVTTRCVNPLQPVYQSLDGDFLVGGPIESLVPANLVDRNTLNFKSFGSLPQRNQWNSSMQLKESLAPTRIPSGRSHSAQSSPHSRQPSARDFQTSSQFLQSHDCELNLSSTSTTSQYLDLGMSTPNSRDGRRMTDEDGSKSYAEKFHTDAQVLIVNHHHQNQDRHEIGPARPSSNSLRSSSSAPPRRSLSSVPQLSNEIFHSSNHVTPRERKGSGRLSAERSQQSSGRKPPRSDSFSSKRQSAELEAEISAIRGL